MTDEGPPDREEPRRGGWSPSHPWARSARCPDEHREQDVGLAERAWGRGGAEQEHEAAERHGRRDRRQRLENPPRRSVSPPKRRHGQHHRGHHQVSHDASPPTTRQVSGHVPRPDEPAASSTATPTGRAHVVLSAGGQHDQAEDVDQPVEAECGSGPRGSRRATARTASRRVSDPDGDRDPEGGPAPRVGHDRSEHHRRPDAEHLPRADADEGDPRRWPDERRESAHRSHESSPGARAGRRRGGRRPSSRALPEGPAPRLPRAAVRPGWMCMRPQRPGSPSSRWRDGTPTLERRLRPSL
jgi:hypothetical protein